MPLKVKFIESNFETIHHRDIGPPGIKAPILADQIDLKVKVIQKVWVGGSGLYWGGVMQELTILAFLS